MSGSLPLTMMPRQSVRSRQLELARLRSRAARLFALRDLAPNIAGAPHRWRIALPADPDAPLDEFAGRPDRTRTRATPANGRDVIHAAAEDALRILATGEHMPYWALLWPSGQALAEALLTAREPSWRGARGLELGCGLGLTASAAVQAGINFTAADCYPETLLFCRYNVLRNTGRRVRTLLLDWRTAAGRALCDALAPLPVLLAADVLYEREDIAPLLDMVPRMLAPGGTFWLAEPGRKASRAFVEEALARGWHDDEMIVERAWQPDGDVVRIAVHRFRLPAAPLS